MKASHSCLLGGLLGLFAACETVVDVPEPAHTPRLALRYTLDTTPPDTATALRHRQLFISTSQRLFDNSPLRGRADAIAHLLDEAGAVVEEFRAGRPYGTGGYYYGYDTLGYYVPTRGFAGVPGRTYRLRVEAPGVDAAEAALTLPPAPVSLSGAAFAPIGTPTDYERLGSFSVTIQDDPATADYYAAFARVVDSAGRAVPYIRVTQQFDNTTGPDTEVGRLVLSDGDNTGALSVWPYADTDVNGRAFSFSAKLSLQGGYYDPSTGGAPGLPPGTQLEVTISRLTPDTYRFWLSQQRYFNADGNPFAEPAPLYSNIQPGFGLFGGAVDATVRVPLN